MLSSSTWRDSHKTALSPFSKAILPKEVIPINGCLVSSMIKLSSFFPLTLAMVKNPLENIQ